MKILPFALKIAAAAAATPLIGVAVASQTTLSGRDSTVMEIRVPGKSSVARVWAQGENGALVPYYSLSLDGRTFGEPKATHYDLLLRFERFDPISKRPDVPANLRADRENRLMIVQYWTQGIEDYREVVRGLGGEIHMFLANHANVVELDRVSARAVQELTFVRSVTPFHPAFKLEEELLESIRDFEQGDVTVNLLTTRRHGHAPVIAWIAANGGTVEHVSKETHLMTVKLRYEQLPALAALNDVQWIDRWGPPEADMDIARQFHGATFVAARGGFTGTGVNIEVLDQGCSENHPDLQNFLLHNQNTPSAHGTSTSGIVFGTGSGNPRARGACPGGLLVIGNFDTAWSGGSRYNHTGELTNPTLPYDCVVQTNSWGGPRTTQYTSLSFEMDMILFDHAKISIFQSQGNSGNPVSRPEAWAKNVVAIGGINHFNTRTKVDDRWTGASTGPAVDDRIKPDMASFYDGVLTTATGGYNATFGGTSSATAIAAGMAGVFYEMWAANLFGTVPGGGSVFSAAPFNTTAKAMLICTSGQWSFEGVQANRTRTHQGWGHPNLRNLMKWRDGFLVDDESTVLTNLETATYRYRVPPQRRPLRATLVYRDPPGTTASLQHRINNLDLKLTSPSGEVYWGNHSLRVQNFSQPGGAANQVDTVENVWVRSPEQGRWTIEVIAAEVNQDSHVETPEVDVDFALVVVAGTGRRSNHESPEEPAIAPDRGP